MGRRTITAPKTGRLRRTQLSFQVHNKLMDRIKAATVVSGHSVSGECEDRIERTFTAEDMMALRYGANSPLVETIADATDAARRWGEKLAIDQRLDQDAADVRTYIALLKTVRTIVDWHDPARTEKIVNPENVGDGALTWETLPAHAAWSALNRASRDPKRLAAFKAINAKFQKMRPR